MLRIHSLGFQLPDGVRAVTFLGGQVTENGVVVASYAPGGVVPTGRHIGHEPSEAEKARHARIAKNDTW